MAQRSLILLLSEFPKPLPVDEDWPMMPAFQRLLSKGTPESVSKDLVSRLLDLFHLPVDATRDQPVAPISALGDDLDAASGWWLRVDPVHMVADRDQLYLSASETLGLRQDEADTLMTELNLLYADEGWLFVAATPQRWYLRLPQALIMQTTPTVDAIGRRVGEILPQGKDALLWQRVMTEIQMLLHASPVNTRRTESGLLTVNSLWFWGGGSLPQILEGGEWSHVVADDPLALGLAKCHGISARKASSSTLDSISTHEGCILWQTNAESLKAAEQQLFEPLLVMLKTGDLTELIIDLPGLARYRVDRMALRRWWRRRKPLAALLKGTK